MGFVSFLCSDLASSVFVFPGLGWFNDVGEGRFGGVAGVFFELCDTGFEIDRKITQGTRSDWGNRWQERITAVGCRCFRNGLKKQ